MKPPEEIKDFLAWLDRQEDETKLEAYGLLHSWLATQSIAPSASSDDFPGKFGMVGESLPMQEVYQVLDRIVRTDVPVLVLGESGTGKELVAKALHSHGSRRKKKFVPVNCAAIPPQLLEAELFGHLRGSFTGAHKDRIGCAEEADGGTLFLDEIGDMPPELQAKLLRFLQDGEIRPVGSNEVRLVQVRVVAATNQDLPSLIASGGFREDLYYRLSVISLRLPPLRERAGDIPLLARFLLTRNAAENLPTATLSTEAITALNDREWPGNIRELHNALTRAATFCQDGQIVSADLSG